MNDLLDKMHHIARSQIRSAIGDDGLAKAEVVAARAALLKAWDPEIEDSALIVGLWVGHSGDMPETLPPLSVLGAIMALSHRLNDDA